MVNLVLFVLIPTLALFLGSIAYIAKRHGELLEEDHLGDVRFVSPAFKIIKNIVVKTFLSMEIILTLATMYILSFSIAYVAVFTYASQSLDMEPRYSLLLAKMGAAQLDVVDERVSSYVALLQIFNPLKVDNRTYYALLIGCKNHSRVVGLPEPLGELCGHVEEERLVIDMHSAIDYAEVRRVLGFDIDVVASDLKGLIDLELAPGLFAVHSVGTVGGISLRIEQADMLMVLPLSDKVLARLCPGGCNAQSIVLGFGKEPGDSDISLLLDFFDYVILKRDSKAMVVSRSYIPTLKTVLGMVLALAISMLMVYAIGGGFIEKLRGLGHSLFVVGITREFFISIVVLGTAVAFVIALLPMAILCWFGFLNCIAPLNFALSSVGFLTMTSYRLRRSIGPSAHHGFAPSYSYVVEGHVPPEELAICIKGFLEKDDFYQLREFKVVKEGERHIVRIGLIYRRALLTVLSVEVYIDRIDHGVKCTVMVDVWSMEDLSRRTLTSIHQMALSKIVGGVISCIEA